MHIQALGHVYTVPAFVIQWTLYPELMIGKNTFLVRLQRFILLTILSLSLLCIVSHLDMILQWIGYQIRQSQAAPGSALHVAWRGRPPSPTRSSPIILLWSNPLPCWGAAKAIKDPRDEIVNFTRQHIGTLGGVDVVFCCRWELCFLCPAW